MVGKNEDSMQTAFTVTTDYRKGTTTGISAQDRALTIRALVDQDAQAADFSKPGHLFPLRAARGGVLQRPGHTEAAVDLTRLTGMRPGGVLAEIVNEDGSMARMPQLIEFARKYDLPLITIDDLIAYRRRTEKIVERKCSTRLPTQYGIFTAHGYADLYGEHEHVALTMGDIHSVPSVLVRVHSECLTGEVFGSLRCDCQPQLEASMKRVAEEGTGVIVYMRGHEGRGIGLLEKLRAYELQDKGFDTAQANVHLGLQVDSRDYSSGASILRDLGVSKMRLMTNNPKKYEGISKFGLSITERIPLTTTPHCENLNYLESKQKLFGHLLGLAEVENASAY